MFGRNDNDERASKTDDTLPGRDGATSVTGSQASPVHSEDRVASGPAGAVPGIGPRDERVAGRPEPGQQLLSDEGDARPTERHDLNPVNDQGRGDPLRDDRPSAAATPVAAPRTAVSAAQPHERVEIVEPADRAQQREMSAGPETQPQPVVVDDMPTQPVGLVGTVPNAATERDREAEREARQRALGVRTRTEESGDYVAPVRHKRTTDRWHGSLAFTILRLVTAAILGVRAWQHLTHLAQTQEYYSHSILPAFRFIGLTVGIIEAVIAVLLLIGLATRFAGLLLLAFEVAALVLFVWGKVNPFSDGRIGFNGELELLLAAVGLLFLLLGSGGWAFDAAFRRSRAAAKEDKAMGNTV